VNGGGNRQVTTISIIFIDIGAYLTTYMYLPISIGSQVQGLTGNKNQGTEN